MYILVLVFVFIRLGIMSAKTTSTTETTTAIFTPADGSRPPQTRNLDDINSIQLHRAGWLVTLPVVLCLLIGTVIAYRIRKNRMMRQRERLRRHLQEQGSVESSTISRQVETDDYLPPPYELAVRQSQLYLSPPAYEDVVKCTHSLDVQCSMCTLHTDMQRHPP